MNASATDNEPALLECTAPLQHEAPRREIDGIEALLQSRPVTLASAPFPEVIVGELVAMADDGQTPLVTYPGQTGTTALRARAILDLHGAHIGKSVLLSFQGGDGRLPIVMGVIRQPNDHQCAAGQVEVDADGERMIISAQQQMVLRCGKASITLTKAGKVLIEGTHVLSRSSGTNRIKGGSVQIN